MSVFRVTHDFVVCASSAIVPHVVEFWSPAHHKLGLKFGVCVEESLEPVAFIDLSNKDFEGFLVIALSVYGVPYTSWPISWSCITPYEH